MTTLRRFVRLLLLFALSNAPLWAGLAGPVWQRAVLLAALVLWFLAFQVRPWREKGVPRRLRVMMGGYELFRTAGLCAAAETVLYVVLLLAPRLGARPNWFYLLVNLAVLLPVLFLTVCNGFGRMLFTSVQLGVLWRALLLCLWWCPVVNLFLFRKACRTVRGEYRFETAKLDLDQLRKENEVCATRYPVVLVHGIFFRDWQLINYWGRIPKELIRNGARLYYGGQQSSAAVAVSAAELRETVLRVLAETGAEKVNLIAHSKGGLDARYAVSRLGLAPYVASLTTINCPVNICTTRKMP